MLGETRRNYPEGDEQKPWCPYTKLVQIGNKLAGIEVSSNHFCYEELRDARYSDGYFPHLEGGNFYAKTSCSKATKELIEQLESVNEKPEVSSERNAIISRWRNVVFETCCSTNADERNEHFRQFSSAEELTEDEIIGKVKQFTDALRQIVGFNEGSIAWLIGDVKNCNQAPNSRHIGKYY